jgi:hypothetical protein
VSSLPAKSSNPYHNPYHNTKPVITGVLTPFACTGSSGSTATSTFVNQNVHGVRQKFVSARIDESDNNTAGAGATVDGIDGFPFNSISFWVSSSALDSSVADRFRIRVIGGDSNGNFINQLVQGNDNISITNAGNGFSQITLTPSTPVGDLDEISELTRFYIFVRPNSSHPNLSALIGNIKINGVAPVANTTVGTVPCPKDFDN